MEIIGGATGSGRCWKWRWNIQQEQQEWCCVSSSSSSCIWRPLPSYAASILLLCPRPRPTTSTSFFTTANRPPFLFHHQTASSSSSSSSSSDVEATTSRTRSDPSILLKNKAAEISPALKGTSVFLVGMNCSIKSHLGEVLAHSLRYYYFDSDALVKEAAAGKSTVRPLIHEDEEGFRETEMEVLKQLSSMGRLVLCAGNGAVQSAANLALLRHGISVWIDVPLDMVAGQVLEDTAQLPASELTITGSHSEVLTQLNRVYEKSRSGYTAADSTVSLSQVASKLGYEDLAEVTVEDMVLEVLNELQKLTRVKKMMEEAARPF